MGNFRVQTIAMFIQVLIGIFLLNLTILVLRGDCFHDFKGGYCCFLLMFLTVIHTYFL